jgi:hypothetical protein
VCSVINCRGELAGGGSLTLGIFEQRLGARQMMMGVYNGSQTSDAHLIFRFARYGILDSGYAAPVAGHPELGKAAESCQSYA